MDRHQLQLLARELLKQAKGKGALILLVDAKGRVGVGMSIQNRNTSQVYDSLEAALNLVKSQRKAMEEQEKQTPSGHTSTLDLGNLPFPT